MKKFLALMALVVCLMLVFVACDNNGDEVPTDEPATEAPTTAVCSHEYDNNCDATCNLCGEKREVTHTEVVLEAKSATCTESGLTEGKKCSVCGTITVAQEKIPATRHTEEVIKGVSATCTSTGLTDGKKCSVCGEILVAQTTIMATGHKNVETVAGKDATCTETGLTEGKKCSDCGAWVIEQAIIPEKGHVAVYVGTIEPTCTESGHTGATKCVVCGKYLDYGEEIEATGHNPEHVIEINAKAPTCTEWGWTAGSYCLDCGQIVDGYEYLEPTGHDFKNYKYNNDATCVFDGTETAKCENCDATDTRVKADTKGHTYGEYTSNNDATCTADGTKTAYCTRCNAEKTIKDEDSALGHDWKNIDAKEANCTEYGWDAYTKCERCGETDGYNEIPKKGHTEVSIGEAKDPTCTEAGTTAGVKCDVCNAIIEAQKSIPATGHTNKIIEAVAPYCTTEGHTAGVECATCGEILVETRVIAELGHDRDPENRNICKRCGDGCEHDAGLVNIAEVKPTCTKDGTVAGTQCPLCKKYQIITKTDDGETITWETALEVIPALGHDYEHHDGKAPTCTEGGYDAYDTCGRCDYTTYNALDALDHNYKADCGSQCTRCDYVRDDMEVECEYDSGSCLAECINCGETMMSKHIGFQYGQCTRCGDKDPAYAGVDGVLSFQEAWDYEGKYLLNTNNGTISGAASHDGWVCPSQNNWVFVPGSDYSHTYTDRPTIKIASTATRLDIAFAGWIWWDTDAGFQEYGAFVDGIESKDQIIYNADASNHFDMYNGTGVLADKGMSDDLAAAGMNGARRYYITFFNTNSVLWNKLKNDIGTHTIYITAKLSDGTVVVVFQYDIEIVEHTCTYPADGTQGVGTVTAPTCEDDGYTTVNCDRHDDILCSNTTKINIVSATGHDYQTGDNWTYSNGKHSHVCQNPGCSKKIDEAVCEGADGSTCDVCGNTYACKHLWNFNADGSITCGGICGDTIKAPSSYYGGNNVYTSATTGNAATFTKNNRLTANEGYVTITGDGKEDGDNQGATLCLVDGSAGQYIVIRYRTNNAFELMVADYVQNAKVSISASDTWTTVIINRTGKATAGRIDYRFNIGGGDGCKTDVSHIATFATESEAQAWAEVVNGMNDTCITSGHNAKVIESGTKIACSVCGGVIYAGSNSSYGDSSFLATCPNPNGGTVTNNGSYVTLAGCGSQMQYIDANADRYIVAVYRKGTASYTNFGACYYNTKTSGHQMAFASFTVGSRDWNNQVGATTSTSDNFCIGIIDMKCKANETHSIISFIPDNGGTGSTDLALYATFATQAEAEAFAAALAYVSIT